MILEGVTPVYSTNPTQNSVRVVEWRTYFDSSTNKTYTESRQYSIQLYNQSGIEKEYTNRSTVDMRV
jgi:hypothetical protein